MLPRLAPLLLVLGLMGCTGCGTGSRVPAAAPVPFSAAAAAAGTVTVRGALEPGSVRRDSGRGTMFTLSEPGTSEKLNVVAPPEGRVPADLESATEVTVSGKWDPMERRLRATSVTR
jgi:hypothetical protein